MLILSVEEASMLADIACKPGGGSQADGLTLILNMMLPRIEGAMNVASLVRGSFTDHFILPRMCSRSDDTRIKLRLSNGYVVSGSVQMLDPDGSPVDTEYVEVDYELGVVTVTNWSRGPSRVSYQSGFEVDAGTGTPPPPPVLKNVDDWIKALAVEFLVEWFRTSTIAPKVVRDTSYAAVEGALRRHIYARIYNRYMRPRVDVVWSERMDSGN